MIKLALQAKIVKEQIKNTQYQMILFNAKKKKNSVNQC